MHIVILFVLNYLKIIQIVLQLIARYYNMYLRFNKGGVMIWVKLIAILQFLVLLKHV